MVAVSKRQRHNMEEIVRVNPVLYLATISLSGQLHSSAVRFAPNETLQKLFWVAMPQEQHSRDIVDPQEIALGAEAQVSGSICFPLEPGKQPKGLAFEGNAVVVAEPDEFEEALGALVTHKVFSYEELEAASFDLEKSDSALYAYAATVSRWTNLGGQQPHLQIVR